MCWALQAFDELVLLLAVAHPDSQINVITSLGNGSLATFPPVL